MVQTAFLSAVSFACFVAWSTGYWMSWTRRRHVRRCNEIKIGVPFGDLDSPMLIEPERPWPRR